jgi:hypothetical protein
MTRTHVLRVGFRLKGFNETLPLGVQHTTYVIGHGEPLDLVEQFCDNHPEVDRDTVLPFQIIDVPNDGIVEFK